LLLLFFFVSSKRYVTFNKNNFLNNTKRERKRGKMENEKAGHVLPSAVLFITGSLLWPSPPNCVSTDTTILYMVKGLSWPIT
jgi:hypothetical protein